MIFETNTIERHGEQNETHSEMIPTALKLLQSQEDSLLIVAPSVQAAEYTPLKGKHSLNRAPNNLSCQARPDKSACLLISDTQKMAKLSAQFLQIYCFYKKELKP